MQPQLVLIANHELEYHPHRGMLLPKVNIPQACVAEYVLRYKQLTGVDMAGTCSVWPENRWVQQLQFNYYGVQVNLQKHIMQMRFPFIYRAMTDFVPLRQSIFGLLRAVYEAYGSTGCAVHPSYWSYSWLQANGEWQLKRLSLMQYKILNECVSYKRTLLNLIHCLNTPCSQWSEVALSNYTRWWKGSAYLEE